MLTVVQGGQATAELVDDPPPIAPTAAPSETAQLEAAAADLEARAQELEQHARAKNTRRGYAADWNHFAAWCAATGREALPATSATVRLYLTAHATTRSASTLERRLVAIGRKHETAGHEPPTRANAVRNVLSGIKRSQAREGGMGRGARTALLLADLRVIVAKLPHETVLWAKRDRALLLLGFAGAFRRSEIVALNVADIASTREGLVITLRQSKTDQQGEGRKVGIPYGVDAALCPVTAYREWLQSAGIVKGAVFRRIDRHGHIGPNRLHPNSVADIVKTAVVRGGLDPAQFAGHSLRSGFATSAAVQGVPERDIAKQTGHKSMKQLRKYIQDGELFRGNAASGAGL